MKEIRMAQNEIFNKYFMVAIGVARKYFNNIADVEHAAIIALENIFSKYEGACLKTIDENGGYVYMMIKNTCISEWRKMKTQKKYNTLADDFAMYDVSIQPSFVKEEDERIAWLFTEISKLSEREQKVVSLKFYDGLSYDDIAEEININPHSMGTLYTRTIKKLRSKVA